MIIEIAGKAHSGKDFVAKKLQSLMPDHEITHFADPLKRVLSLTFNVNINDYKDVGVVTLGSTSISVRTLLQRFGTEAMQSVFGKNVWVNLIDRTKPQIIADFRFRHEYLPESFTINVTRNEDLILENTHVSEHDLDNFAFDFTIINDETLDQQLQTLVKQLKSFTTVQDLVQNPSLSCDSYSIKFKNKIIEIYCYGKGNAKINPAFLSHDSTPPQQLVKIFRC